MSTENPPTPQLVKKRSLSFWVWIPIILITGVAAFCGYVALQPEEFRIERSTTIAAPPDVVFTQVNDFHNWDAWSPWAKLDPNAKNKFEGSESGEGAKFSWAGNSKVGVGSMTIKEVVPDERIRIQLDFEQPFKDTSTAEFTFQPQGEQTKVTWAMFGKYQNFLQKAMCKAMNMDKMLGGEFEKGLASMKQASEQK